DAKRGISPSRRPSRFYVRPMTLDAPATATAHRQSDVPDGPKLTKKMDWFFNEYVYGTGIPQYQFHAPAEPTSDGKTRITGQLLRTGVPDGWKDVVPMYGHV